MSGRTNGWGDWQAPPDIACSRAGERAAAAKGSRLASACGQTCQTWGTRVPELRRMCGHGVNDASTQPVAAGSLARQGTAAAAPHLADLHHAVGSEVEGHDGIAISHAPHCGRMGKHRRAEAIGGLVRCPCTRVVRRAAGGLLSLQRRGPAAHPTRRPRPPRPRPRCTGLQRGVRPRSNQGMVPS